MDENGRSIDSFEFIDQFGERLGITATIFKSEGNDFIRVVTNIQNDDGSRAVGTYLGHNYLTAYNPMRVYVSKMIS